MAKNNGQKESKALVKVVYFPSKTLSDGSHPFMLRITKDRKRKYVATGLSLHPDYWDTTKNTFRKNVPRGERRALEAAFHTWEVRYSNAAETLAEADEQHDAETVALMISQKRIDLRQFKLLSFFDELINQFGRTGKVGNRKVYRDVRNKLQRFIGEDQDVPFSAVTVRFCNEWETKMLSEGLTEITLSVKFRTLRTVLNKAIANG